MFLQAASDTAASNWDTVTVVVTIVAGAAASILQLIIRQFALGAATQHFAQVGIAIVLALFAGLAVVATMDTLSLHNFTDWLAAAGIALGASQAFYAIIIKLVAPPSPS